MRHLIQHVFLLTIAFLCACTGEIERSDMVTPEEDMSQDISYEDQRDDAPDAEEMDEADQADLGDLDASDAAPDMEDLAPDMPEEPRTSAGCVDGEGLAEGEHTFMLEGRQRRYIVRLPQGYTRERPWPLVLALHGNGGSASYWDVTSGARNIRAVLREEAILIVAEAIEGNWRDYNAAQGTWPGRVEQELRYFDEVLTQARGALCVEEEAIFAMGFSGGGSFAGVLGCRRDDIRAIAAGGAVLYYDPASCMHTPAAWITIGTQELNSGREAFRDDHIRRASEVDGGPITSTATQPAPCISYVSVRAETPVHYCQHPDGHVWPDFGAQAMWAFFKVLVPARP